MYILRGSFVLFSTYGRSIYIWKAGRLAGESGWIRRVLMKV